MISIVVCSIRPQMAEALARNIEASIGVEYELIVIDNRGSDRGLCRVYNEGAGRARYEVVCFMHEDVEFLEAGWGRNVLAHFAEDPQLGVIGVAGARFKSRAPSGWMTSGRERYNCSHLHQGCGPDDELLHSRRAGDERRIRVCTLDGVWICARRAVWEALRFNEQLRNFHFYDVDFALRASQEHAVAVVYDVALRHFSGGHFDGRWMEEALAYHQRIVSVPLPMALDDLDEAVLRRLERRGIHSWLKFLRKAKVPLALRWRWLRACRVQSYPGLWWLALKFLFYYPLKFR